VLCTVRTSYLNNIQQKKITVLIANYQLQWFIWEVGNDSGTSYSTCLPECVHLQHTAMLLGDLITASTAVVHPRVCWSAQCTSPFSLLTQSLPKNNSCSLDCPSTWPFNSNFSDPDALTRRWQVTSDQTKQTIPLKITFLQQSFIFFQIVINWQKKRASFDINRKKMGKLTQVWGFSSYLHHFSFQAFWSIQKIWVPKI